jgi:hypothetical protein
VGIVTNYEVYPKISEQTNFANIFNNRVDFDYKCAVLGEKCATKNSIRLPGLFVYFNYLYGIAGLSLVCQ